MSKIRTIKTRTGWRLERIGLKWETGTQPAIECRRYSRAELERMGIYHIDEPDALYPANVAYTNAEYAWDCGYPSKQQWKELA